MIDNTFVICFIDKDGGILDFSDLETNKKRIFIRLY